MTWPVTINGNTYTEAMFVPYGYVTNFPAILSDLATVADGIASSASGIVIGALALTGDISPGQITGNQDNYAPTGYATASTMRLFTDASRNITGIAGGSDGKILTLHNIGTFNIVLINNATSTEANRFLIGFDFTLVPNRSITFRYDATTARWRPFGQIEPAWTLTVITATNATWPVPAGTSEMMIHAFGGGGSGAGGNTSSGQRLGGGGGGGYCFKHHKGVIDSTLNITIGAGGAAVTSGAGGTAGNNGGNTTVVGTALGTLNANGGSGAPTSGAGGAGGTASNGDINDPGQAGQVLPEVTSSGGVGEGGSCPNGGFGGRSNVGTAGAIPGGGGSCSNHTAAADSGAGARGEVRIWTR
jgi:hypothetical protein